MAYGYRDYWTRVTPQKAIFGEGQTPVYYGGFQAIVSSGEDDVFTYTVPAGYVFYPSYLVVSCNQPSTHRLIIVLGTNLLAAVYWDSTIQISFPESGMVPVPAGKTVYPAVENGDDITITFYGFIIGFLEPI